MFDSIRQVRPTTWLLGFGVSVIILISMIGFAPASPYALINADSAIYMLMTKDFSGIQDLYYWGQNRSGSAVPFLGHQLTKVMPLDWAASLAQYIFWIIGYSCFQRWLTGFLSKLLLALLWFLPCSIWEFGMIGHPYATAFAFLGMGLVLLDPTVRPVALTHKIQRSPRFAALLQGIAGVSLMASLWVSDSFVVHVLLIPFFAVPLQILKCQTEVNHPSQTSLITKLRDQIKQLKHIKSAFGMGLLCGLVGIIIAKTVAPGVFGYIGLMTPIEMFDIWGRIVQNLFQGGRVPTLMLGWLFLLILLRFWNKQTRQDPMSWLWQYGLLSAASISFLILISKWLYMNSPGPEIGYRYFAQVQMWLNILLCLGVDRLRLDREPIAIRSQSFSKPRVKRSLRLSAIGLSVLVSSIVCFSVVTSYSVLLTYAKMPTPALRSPKLVADLNQLAPAGVIGDYWTAYLWCGTDARFSCTPHDKAMVRQPRYVEDVKRQNRVYVVKTLWLESFPDRLDQFGRTLQRTGPEQKVGQWDVALYQWLP